MSNKNLDNLIKNTPRGLVGSFLWNNDNTTHEYSSRLTTDHAEVNVPLEQGRKYKVTVHWSIYFSGTTGRYTTFTTSLNGVSRVRKIYGTTESSIVVSIAEIFDHTGADVASALCNCIWTGVDIEEGYVHLLCEDVGAV